MHNCAATTTRVCGLSNNDPGLTQADRVESDEPRKSIPGESIGEGVVVPRLLVAAVFAGKVNER